MTTKALLLICLVMFSMSICPLYARQDTSTFKSEFSQKYTYATGKLKSKKYHIYVSKTDTVYIDNALVRLGTGNDKFLRRSIISKRDGILMNTAKHEKGVGYPSNITMPSTGNTLCSYIQQFEDAHTIKLSGQKDMNFRIEQKKKEWIITKNEEMVGYWKIVDEGKQSAILLELNYQPSEETLRAWEFFTFTFATEQIIMKKAKVKSSIGGFALGLLKSLL